MNSQTVLTQDFTTDLQGRILSMTYDTAGEGGYDGELYFHYDHFGNTTLLTDEEGDPVFSAQYNPCRGKTVQTWNTSNLEIINQGQGRNGTVSMSLPGNNTALIASSGSLTISEETIASFNTRAAKAVCYIDSGYGQQEGNPDANPCASEDCNELISNFAQDFTMFIGWNKAKKNFNETGVIYVPILIVTPFGFNYELQKQEDDEKIQTELENCMEDCENIRDSGCEIPVECYENYFI